MKFSEYLGRKYVHGVDLENDILVHNLGVGQGKMISTDFLGTHDPGIRERHRRVATVPISEIATMAMDGNVLSPRLSKFFTFAAILESGRVVVDGYDRIWEITDGQKRRIFETRNLELAFEEGRRRFAPDSPSRLTCIWLAEDSPEGKGVIRWMMPNVYIAQARIDVATGYAEVDSSWFDAYLNSPKPEFIERYWAGEAHPKEPRKEILVDGVVQLTDPAQLQHIKESGAPLLKGKRYWRST